MERSGGSERSCFREAAKRKHGSKNMGSLEKMDIHAEIVVSIGKWESNDLPEDFGATN
jgi:hypothetical protein